MQLIDLPLTYYHAKKDTVKTVNNESKEFFNPLNKVRPLNKQNQLQGPNREQSKFSFYQLAIPTKATDCFHARTHC